MHAGVMHCAGGWRVWQAETPWSQPREHSPHSSTAQAHHVDEGMAQQALLQGVPNSMITE